MLKEEIEINIGDMAGNFAAAIENTKVEGKEPEKKEETEKVETSLKEEKKEEVKVEKIEGGVEKEVELEEGKQEGSEVEVEEEEEEEVSFLDEFKAKEGTKEESKKKEVKPEIDEAVKKKLTFLEELEKDPLLKSVIEARLNNEDVYQHLEKYKPKDVSKLTANDLKKELFKEVEDTFAKYYSGDDLQEKIEQFENDFESQSEFQKIKEYERVRKDIEQREQEKLKMLQSTPKKNEITPELEAKIVKAQKTMQSISQKAVGQQYMGVELTNDIVNSVIDKIASNKGVYFEGEDAYDAAKTFEANLRVELASRGVELAAKKARGEAKDELYKERNRPSDYTLKTPKNKEIAQREKQEKAILDGLKSVFGGF